MSDTYTLIEILNDSPEFADWPPWKRSAVLGADDVVYAPAIVGGSELAVSVRAAYDGTPAYRIHGHMFFPTSWLVKEYPDTREVCEKIERVVRSSPPDSAA